MKHKQSPQNSTQVFVLPTPLLSFPFSASLAFKKKFLLVSWKWCHLVPIWPKFQQAQISLWFRYQFVFCFIFNIMWNASGCCWSKQIALLSNCYHSQKNTRREGSPRFLWPRTEPWLLWYFQKSKLEDFFQWQQLLFEARLETWDLRQQNWTSAFHAKTKAMWQQINIIQNG